MIHFYESTSHDILHFMKNSGQPQNGCPLYVLRLLRIFIQIVL